MANKGTKNFLGGIKNPFRKPDPAEQQQQEQIHVSGLRDRERNMIALLEGIKLKAPMNRLSPEKVDQLELQGVIDFAVRELKIPLIVEQDISKLDANLKYIINALDQAVKEGLELTAEWASNALVCGLRNARTEIAGIDEDYADAMLLCKLEYSNNLELLTKSCIEYDRMNNDLKTERVRRQTRRQELDRRKASYQARRDSGDLDALMAEIKMKAHAPATMSDEAKALRTELAELHQLKATIIEIDTSIDAKQVTLTQAKQDIETRRNALSSPPRVTDPQLRDKINDANRRYRERLRRQLNEAEDAMRSAKIHHEGMRDLANASVFISQTVIAMEEDNAMQMEKYEQMLAQKEAQRQRARDAEGMQMIRNSMQEQEQEHVVNTIYEPEVETEQEFEVEYEYN